MNRIAIFLEEKTGAETALRCSTTTLSPSEANTILTKIAQDATETKLSELRLKSLANLGWIADVENMTSRMAEELTKVKEEVESMASSMPSTTLLAALPPQELLATLVASPQLSQVISSLNIILEEMSVLMKDSAMEVQFQQLRDMMEKIGSLPAFTVEETSLASIFKDWDMVATSLIAMLNLSLEEVSNLGLESLSPAPLVLLSLRSSALVSTLCRSGPCLNSINAKPFPKCRHLSKFYQKCSPATKCSCGTLLSRPRRRSTSLLTSATSSTVPLLQTFLASSTSKQQKYIFVFTFHL